MTDLSTAAVPLVEIWRGPFAESVHSGHAVICAPGGTIVEAWGDPDAVVLPRSSAKMLQALPLIASGAADARGLSTAQLALACASHQGAAIHTDPVAAWLGDLGQNDSDLRCGAQWPDDRAAANALIRAHEKPCQIHNNCSGKHAGFLTLSQHLGADSAAGDYIDPDHPVQRACRDAFEDATGQDSPFFGIDGCSAPNFATTVHGMARAMADFAAAPEGSPQARLHQAMRLHPELVAGEGRACTELMRATGGAVALKTGAEAFFIAILPDQKLGVALKITDGGTRAAECAIASILVKLGALKAEHAATLKRRNAVITNWRGVETGTIRPAAALL